MADTPEQVLLLRELLAWTKLQAKDSLIRSLAEALTTDNDRRIYELTDGSLNGTDVAKKAGVSKAAVSQKWKAWRQAGLLIDDARSPGPRHLASLESLGAFPE